MKKTKIIPPLHDVMVAKIFENMGSATAALSLINAVLEDVGKAPLDRITALRCEETLPGAWVDGRSCRLDVVAESQGRLTNIEVQRETYADMIDRSFFHACAIMHGQLDTAKKYSELPRLTMINLLDYKPLRSKHPDFHQPISLIYEKGELELASSILCIHNIELRKFKRMKYDKQNPLHRWLHILSRGYKTINEIETKEVIGMDAGLQQFVDKYSLSLQDPQIQAKYTQHRLAELDYNSSIDTAHEKGMEKMLRILMKQKNLSSAELQMMAQQAGISDERYEQIYNEEMATLS